MTFSKETYINRRKTLAENFENGIIILCGNDLVPMNYASNTYHFVQDATFLYYFGINKEGYIGLIDVDNQKEYLYGSNPTIEDIIWEGDLPSLDSIAKEIGVQNTIDYVELSNLLKDKQVYYTNQYSPNSKLKLAELLNENPYKINEKSSYKLMEVIASQRNKKSSEEIEIMEMEAKVGKAMHLKALEISKVNMKEYEVEAEIRKVALENNSQLSFPSIVTVNGQILHNPNYNGTLEEGRLLLVDAGSRGIHGYCSDMTSTIPVGGRFTPKQKDMYELLIEMYEKAESLIKPKITYKEVHLEVCKVLTKGMIEKGLMTGEVEEIVSKGAHALFMPHGLGHMIGLDVHDMENFGEELVGYGGEIKSTQFGLSSLRLGRMLEEGFVFTVEPGIYFIPQLINKWRDEKKFVEFINYEKVEEYIDFGGMRYEGDYVITSNGARLLGGYRPRHAHEIEEYMNGKK